MRDDDTRTWIGKPPEPDDIRTWDGLQAIIEADENWGIGHIIEQMKAAGWHTPDEMGSDHVHQWKQYDSDVDYDWIDVCGCGVWREHEHVWKLSDAWVHDESFRQERCEGCYASRNASTGTDVR